MFFKEFLAVVLMCLGVVVCEPPVPSAQYGVPYSPGSGGVTNSFGGPNYNNYNGNDIVGSHDHDHSQAMSYEFGYQVKDDYSGNNYGRQEKSDGNEVRGEYRVQLPDGRTQVVTYYADWQTGFHADVRYEGEAQYPDQYNINGIPNQYGAPRVNVNQGNFNRAPGGNQYDNQNYNPGYNYDSPGQNRGFNAGGGNTGYTKVNDGINFNNNYDNYNRNKPVPVYGAP